MDKTKSKLAAFFNNDDDEESFSKPVDSQKLSQYTQGTLRKSKREKEKEREEAKKREEEELAAKTYAEYLDAFEGGSSQRKGSSFVRASSSARGEDISYDPLAREGRSSIAKAFNAEDSTRAPSPPSNAPKPKGKRAMDAFLEEIKREQAEREERLFRSSRAQGRSVTALAAYEGQSGSKDRGDPLTTNVFVANLPANVNEAALGNFFALRCGPVGSVKVMWPRGDASVGPGADMTASRTRKSAGLSGFVSFMKRKDAETAVREIDGFDWGGSVLRVGWSKAVPVASKAAYVAHHHDANSRSRSPSRERSGRPQHRSPSPSAGRHHGRYGSRSRSPKGLRSYSYSRSRSRSPSRRYDRYSRSPSDGRQSRSRSYSPRRHRGDSPRRGGWTGVDPDTEKFIQTVALKVKDNGEKFEDLLRERERQNPKFAFLFDTSTPEYRLYRSFRSGESLVEGFEDEGYNSVYSTDSAEESERERVRKQKLGKLARRRFEAMLRAVSGKRGELARCMAFSLEHAEAASEVTDIIVGSLLVDSTPVPRKVARLHLICDILHNSAASVPNAWKYRQEFQSRLGIVFDHLSSIYHSFPGRITAETFKNQIVAVLDIWEDWIVFTPDFIATLKSRLEGTTQAEQTAEETSAEDKSREQTSGFPSKFKASSFRPAEAVKEPTPIDDDGEADMETDSDEDEKRSKAEEDLDGEPIDDIDGEPVDDIDGEPADDIDGVPVEDLDGEPIDDVDGVPLDDVDGEPMDDIDGMPVAY